jgi:hypothetical protein
MAAQRFGSLGQEEIANIEKQKDSANSKKAITKSVRVLRAYLKERD